MHAMTVAKWFVERANSEFVDDGGVSEGVTNLKLQKLLYFAQAVSLSLRDTPLFEDKIEAWKFGPVVPAVYRALKEYGNKVVEKIDAAPGEEIDADTAALLEDVWSVYGKYSASELVSMTHAQKPWKDVFMKSGNGEISVESLREYYNGYYKTA